MYDQQSGEFRPRFGPLFTNILLADEINRAPPKTQAALLEAMEEKQVTIEGITHKLPAPFSTLATQNPIEQEGTYPLPEAQMDRFLMKMSMGYPSLEEEKAILQRRKLRAKDDYDVTQIVFHGALEYDDSARVVGQAKDSARMLAGMIKQINQNIQKKYKIGKPNFLTVPKHQDFGKMKDKFLGKLKKLQSIYGLKDNDTLSLYHQHYWQEWIMNGAKQTDNPKLTNDILIKLTKRWAFFDKSYTIPMIKKDFKDYPKFLDWVLTTDKVDKNKMVKDNMKPFEELFFGVGAEIMKNVDGWLAVNPEKSVQSIRGKVKAAISTIRSGGDLKKLNKLKIQLDRLNAIGGLDAIIPSEGIVFKYNGRTYKFTGAFAPVNQITGLLMFDR